MVFCKFHVAVAVKIFFLVINILSAELRDVCVAVISTEIETHV